MDFPFSMRRILVIAFLVATTGCGPSAQERYDTALSILQQEQKRMIEVSAVLMSDEQKAYQQAFEEFVGYPPADRNALNKRIDAAKTREEEDELMTELKAIREKSGEFTERYKNPSTEEGKRRQELLRTMGGRQAHEEQKQRLERAKQMVKEAEASL